MGTGKMKKFNWSCGYREMSAYGTTGLGGDIACVGRKEPATSTVATSGEQGGPSQGLGRGDGRRRYGNVLGRLVVPGWGETSPALGGKSRPLVR